MGIVNQDHDRMSELKAFDETKSGVKGLVDAGVTEIPRIFYIPPHDQDIAPPGHFKFPLIDLQGLVDSTDPTKRQEIVEQVGNAAEEWGFFQVINHSIAPSVLEDMIDKVRAFFEQGDELKRDWYSRDNARRIVYNSNFHLYTAATTTWRDTLFCMMAPDTPKHEELPMPVRDIMIDYSKQMMNLGGTIFELLSEALGLKPSYLNDMDCNKGIAAMYHYYPACPQPELTMGSVKHSDNDFITMVLQDQVGGLQVLHQDLWVDVPPIPGSLVVNIGDLLQLVSNDKFKSVQHRVLVNESRSRVSIANLFSTCFEQNSIMYGPIKELLSEDNPPKFRETSIRDYTLFHFGKPNNGGCCNLSHLSLKK